LISWPDVAQSATEPKITSDLIIFARGDALWTITPSGEDVQRLLDLPMPAEEVEELHVSSNGAAILLRAKGLVAWSPLAEASTRKLRFLPCSGPSNISADGGRVVCGTQDGQRIAIYTLQPALAVEIIDRKAAGPLAFAEAEDEIITFGDHDDVIALSQKGARVVSEHRPTTKMLVTPDGKRALGGYQEDVIKVVYTFRLDGKAIKRTLVHAARAVQTSADSQWGAIQQEVDACAVRLAGGQYMCWRQYKALAISSEGHSLLVSRSEKGKQDLFLGAVTGTSSRKPTPLAEGVAGVATFWGRPKPTDSAADQP
jgi:hypothetical protein